MAEIQLSNGGVALVDDADYEWLSQWKWHKIKSYNTHYAARRIKTEKGPRLLLMHRVIMNPPDFKNNGGIRVDHINQDGLDNRRANMRLVNGAQNQWNCRKPKTATTSQYKGVSWSKRARKWNATIRINGKHKNLGYFTDEVEAAKAYDAMAIQTRGEYAAINFPQQPTA